MVKVGVVAVPPAPGRRARPRPPARAALGVAPGRSVARALSLFDGPPLRALQRRTSRPPAATSDECLATNTLVAARPSGRSQRAKSDRAPARLLATTLALLEIVHCSSLVSRPGCSDLRASGRPPSWLRTAPVHRREPQPDSVGRAMFAPDWLHGQHGAGWGRWWVHCSSEATRWQDSCPRLCCRLRPVAARLGIR
jgi:hypothetical protein